MKSNSFGIIARPTTSRVQIFTRWLSKWRKFPKSVLINARKISKFLSGAAARTRKRKLIRKRKMMRTIPWLMRRVTRVDLRSQARMNRRKKLTRFHLSRKFNLLRKFGALPTRASLSS